MHKYIITHVHYLATYKCVLLNMHYYTNAHSTQEQIFASAERTSTTSADKFK